MSVVISKKIISKKMVNAEEPPLFIDLEIGIGGDGYDRVESTNYEAINNSLMLILSTKKGSRVMRPSFGTNISSFLFTQISESNGSRLVAEITTTLDQEPRITVVKVLVFVNKEDSQYEVSIIYRIPRLSDTVYEYTHVMNKTSTTPTNHIQPD